MFYIFYETGDHVCITIHMHFGSHVHVCITFVFQFLYIQNRNNTFASQSLYMLNHMLLETLQYQCKTNGRLPCNTIAALLLQNQTAMIAPFPTPGAPTRPTNSRAFSLLCRSRTPTQSSGNCPAHIQTHTHAHTVTHTHTHTHTQRAHMLSTYLAGTHQSVTPRPKHEPLITPPWLLSWLMCQG